MFLQPGRDALLERLRRLELCQAECCLPQVTGFTAASCGRTAEKDLHGKDVSLEGRGIHAIGSELEIPLPFSGDQLADRTRPCPHFAPLGFLAELAAWRCLTSAMIDSARAEILVSACCGVSAA